MRNYLILAACFVLTANVSGQHRSEKHVVARVAEHKALSTFTRFTPFAQPEASTTRNALIGSVVEDAAFMVASGMALAGVLAQPPEQLTLEIPTAHGMVELDLVRAEIYSPSFSMVTASTDAPVAHTPGAHYRGIIAGQPNTLAAISIFADEVMGFVSDASGNHVLGKLEGSTDEHIYYTDRDLIEPPVFECRTLDEGDARPARLPMDQDNARTVRCVELYWEVDYDIFVDKGGLTNTSNYITGLFNQHATLFDNDGISVVLSEMFIWDVASPYTGWTASALLGQFRSFRNGFNGHVGHLLGYSNDGGLAAFDGLCASDPDNRMCYSGIHASFSGVPVYSFSVNVVTHEEGHVMGSPHTHACAWNGNNTAIDGCGPSEGYPYEGTCGGAPIPANGGTVMSYCHLTPVGINFNNGFGPQPAALIVSNVDAAPCVGACGSAGCDMPTGISSNAMASSATLSWAAVSGATSYTLQWKPSMTATWMTVAGITGTNQVVDGLLAAVTYRYRVRTECAAGSSAYSSVLEFTTPCTLGARCEDGDPLTENDIIIADCVCAGTPRSPLEEINKIVASDRGAGAVFGSSVAISGDYAIVGATGAAVGGAAYIFVRSGTTWVQQQQILVSHATNGDRVGCSVAIDGDFAIVGARFEDLDAMGGNLAHDAGCAYIFMRSGNVWIEQQKLVANDRATLDEFGRSVAISGDHAIVGALYEDHDATGGSEFNSAGSAYIFVRNGATWTQQEKIVASDRNIGDEFGGSVAISGDHAIVGARFVDYDATGGAYSNSAGSAYIFVRSGDTWTQQEKIVASDRGTDDEFGRSVAISGDHAIVGAPTEDHDASGGEYVWKAGSAYVFVHSGDAWTQQEKLVASDRDDGDEFGLSVAISGDRAIVGARYEDRDATGGNFANNAGSAYIFVRGGDDWALHQKIVASDRATIDVFGESVAISADHVVVGALREDEDEFGNNTLVEAGSAYLFAEDSAQVSLALKLWLEGPYDPATQLMNDALRSLPAFPVLEPYTALGFTNAGGGGGETTNAAVLSVSGGNAIVDWVRIELRSSNDPTIIIATRQGLVQRDGDVVSASNGASPLVFDVVPGSYYIAVRHRNHLGCMTSSSIALVPTVNPIDFRSNGTATYGTDARKVISGAMALWAGNSNGDGGLLYTGDENDREPILARIGGQVITAITIGYYAEDVNLSGTVKYVGVANDRDPILVNIGGNTPNNLRLEQLP